MTIDNRYRLLVNALDQIRHSAPDEYRSYYAYENGDSIQNARSKALIHLFLLVKFGVGDFSDRHNFITDGADDGGIDAYYIDKKRKKLYLIQAKFRDNERNALQKEITANELIKMEIRAILQGDTTYQDRHGDNKNFNGKIRQLQDEWRKLPDQARYTYEVVVLGGRLKYNDNQVRRLLGLRENEPFEIYDYNRIYIELLFPFCASRFYDPDEITIELDLNNKEQSVLKQTVHTQQGEFQVRVLFVPVKEIGRVMAKYKNAILKYNPRNYLSLSRNKVNKSIRDGILNTHTNDFAIYNNGITMLCSNFMISETTGKQSRGQVILENPQIINGGQTAYVLSEIYEEHSNRASLNGKEVILRAIVIPDNLDDQSIRDFISGISNATNQQSKVEEADRRSNDDIFISIQKKIFQEFGYLVERKRGEFYEAIKQGYVDERWVIKRDDLLRAYLAYSGKPSEARRSGKDRLFQRDHFNTIMRNGKDYRTMLFAYLVLSKLREEEKTSNNQVWGNGLRYGKMAIVAAVKYSWANAEQDISQESIVELVNSSVERIKTEWKKYEKWVQARKSNVDYKSQDGFDYDNYYKGKTLDQDIKDYYL